MTAIKKYEKLKVQDPFAILPLKQDPTGCHFQNKCGSRAFLKIQGMMRNTGKISLFLLGIHLIAISQQSVAHSATSTRSLSLPEAVRVALKNNVGIQIEKENIRLQESSFFWEEAQFDPALSFDLRANKTIRSSSSLIETGPSGTERIVQENQRLNAGITQRFRSGGDAGLVLRQFRSSASFQGVNPTLNGDLVISFRQPLLKGFGREITEGPIRIANTQIEISQSVFEAQVTTLVLDVSNAYWDLVFQIKNLEVQRQNLKSAKQLLTSSREKVDMGLFAPIEILVAESGVASREEAVFIAEKGVRDTEDELRLLLNLPDQLTISPANIQPTDQPIEKEQSIDSNSLLHQAITLRPEMAENKLHLRNQSLFAKIAKNKVSPSLDLVGSVGLNGLGRDFSDEADQLESGRFNQWEAGFVLSFPIGNHAAWADVQKEKIKLKQAMFNEKRLIQQITLERKEGLRRVQTDFQRIEVTKRARRLAEEKYAAGNERFNLGLISSHNLLEFQDDLANAQGNELKAVIDYNKSLANLSHVTGALRQQYQIETVSR